MIKWDVSPVIFEILGREVRWYGLLFAFGLLLFGPWLVEKIWNKEKLNPDWLNKLYIYVVVGTVVGARLGHVLFYNPSYYLANPAKIFAIWEGGLASHGGTIGVIIALWLYSRNVSKKPLLWILDRVAVPTGLVAAFIRLGNLMNSEIFGCPTELPWAFSFVQSSEYAKLEVLRQAGVALTTEQQRLLEGTMGWHPTQVYEALAYTVVFFICLWLYWRRGVTKRHEGFIIGCFMIGIFGSRLLIESIKLVQEPWELDLVNAIGLNMGQLLSIPFVLMGLWCIIQSYRHQPSTTN